MWCGAVCTFGRGFADDSVPLRRLPEGKRCPGGGLDVFPKRRDHLDKGQAEGGLFRGEGEIVLRGVRDATDVFRSGDSRFVRGEHLFS